MVATVVPNDTIDSMVRSATTASRLGARPHKIPGIGSEHGVRRYEPVGVVKVDGA